MLNHPNLPSRQGRAPRKAQRPQSFAAFLKCVLLALPFTVLLGALLLSACTALLLQLQDPIRYTRIAAPLCLYLTAAFGGMLTTRLYERRIPVWCGLSIGLLLTLCLALPALLLAKDTHMPTAIFLRLLVPMASLAGAVFTARKRKTRHSYRRKR